MKSIILKTIIFIVILIVTFFIIKYLINRKRSTPKIKENLVIEDFQESRGSGYSDLETVFGINADVNFNGFSLDDIPAIENLKSYYLYPTEFIDTTNSNDTDKCLTKYLGLYNLVVDENEELPSLISDSERIQIPIADSSDSTNSFNKTLEDGRYGNTTTLQNTQNILGVKYIFREDNKQDAYIYLNNKFLERIKDMNITPLKLNKFKRDKTETTDATPPEVNNFIDFGVKSNSTDTNYNYYIKNIRFLLSETELDNLKESINKSVFNLTTSVTLEPFLIKSVTGDSNEGGSVKGILSKLYDDIFGIGVESDSVLEILGDGNYTPIQTSCATDRTQCVVGTGVTTSVCTNITTCATVDNSKDTTTSVSTSNNITLKDKMYREYIIYVMELLYCKYSSSLAVNEEIANTLFSLGNEGNTISAISAIKQALPNFDRKLNIENTNINLSYYYHLVLTLLKLRTKVINDNFMSKFNCKYTTYLFYSFNRAETIFGDYITNIGLSSSEKNMLQMFFSSFEFEGLYKLFILSVKGDCKVFKETESNKDRIENGLDLNRIIQEKTLDFNEKYYFFFKKENTRQLNESCKKVKREDCNEANTRGMCSWQSTSSSDPTKGECAASINLTEKCMYINDAGKCNTNPNCSWNSVDGICKPTNCSDGTKCLSDSEAGISIPHCRSLTFEENSEVKQKCFDKERVMYISSNTDNIKHSNPDSFFKRSYNHLNECEDGIYSSLTDSFINGAEETCSSNGSKSCNFLEKNTGAHNPSNFRTCVHDELVDLGNFFSCGDIKEKEKCDSKTSRFLSCFWQDGKCYRRDAPLHWITPGSNDYGIEDMTDCRNFSSEFSCPVDRCIWHFNEDTRSESCIRKEDHPYYDEVSVAARAPPTVPTIIPIKKELVDCDAINNAANANDIDAGIECNSFKCKWDSQICSANVGNMCALHKSKAECLDEDKNYDSVAQKNMCRWSDNMSNTYCGKISSETECNRMDLCVFDSAKNKCKSRRPETGFCTDTRMLQPCQLFDKETCPTEVKVDNMGNKFAGSNHCKLDGDLCVNNPEIFTDGQFDNCHYDYLNTGNCDVANCRLKDLYDSAKTGLNIKKCIARESMPCSMLTRDECVEPIVGDSCYWNYENLKCSPTQNMQSLKDVLSNVANVGNDEYKQIQGVTKQFDNINFVTNENKKYYMRDIEPVIGLVTKLKLKGVEGALNNTQLIYTNTENVKKVTVGDIIEITSNSAKFDVFPNTEVHQFKVKSVDNYEKIIEIETNNSDVPLIKINNQIQVDELNDGSGASVKWSIKNPNLGLFGSYQHSQAMIDSMKINDFYNNFF